MSDAGKAIWGNLLISADVEHLKSEIKKLEQSGVCYHCSDIVRSFMLWKSRPSFEDYFRSVIARLELSGRVGSMKTYKSTLASFQRFSSGHEHMPNEITSKLVVDYQGWLSQTGLMENSVSFYVRHIRAVYRMMVAEGLVVDSRPFAGVSTGIAKTRKRSITEAELKEIYKVDLSDDSALSFTRDLFMLSFYCMGMPFVDIAFLRKEDVKGSRIEYRRKKTGQTISMRVLPKIKAILERYPSEETSPYVLPLISRPYVNERLQYENSLRYANRNLKKIARRAGVKSSTSTYPPRHTWASIAKMRNVALSTISDALGHDNESTTQIYLATLDYSHVDMANELVTKGF